MREEITPVLPADLIGEVAKLKIQGYRLVTLSCTEIDADRIDVLYHFDKDLLILEYKDGERHEDAVGAPGVEREDGADPDQHEADAGLQPDVDHI